MPKTDFLEVMCCGCVEFKVLGSREVQVERYGPGASACAWCRAKLMTYGRFGGAPKFGQPWD